jgi:hypothetical protein
MCLRACACVKKGQTEVIKPEALGGGLVETNMATGITMDIDCIVPSSDAVQSCRLLPEFRRIITQCSTIKMEHICFPEMLVALLVTTY